MPPPMTVGSAAGVAKVVESRSMRKMPTAELTMDWMTVSSTLAT